MATSAPARSTRCARRWSRPAAPAATPRRRPCSACSSLILWALIVVVTLKYVLILLRADNHGEGGTLALMALAQRAVTKGARRHRAARHHLRRAVLRRRRHHAGAVGAVGDRRHQARHRRPSIPMSFRSRWSSWWCCSRCSRAAPRSVAAFFGPVMCVWFAVIAIAAVAADHAASRSAARAQSALCRFLHDPSRRHRLRDARRGVPRRHRRRGAVCRSRPFRQAADPDRVAVHRAAVAGAELSGAGRAADCRSQGDREPVLPDVSGLGADPDGGAGDGGDRDREPGRHHRRLFADAAGDPARADAAVRNPPYLGSAFRPDLHPAHQHAAVVRGAAAGAAVPLLQRAGLGLRHLGDRHHGGHGDDGLCGDLEGLEVVADRGRRADRAVSVPRSHLPRGQPAEGVRGRLGAAGARRQS